jgi:hypothetical protein
LGSSQLVPVWKLDILLSPPDFYVIHVSIFGYKQSQEFFGLVSESFRTKSAYKFAIDGAGEFIAFDGSVDLMPLICLQLVR